MAAGTLRVGVVSGHHSIDELKAAGGEVVLESLKGQAVALRNLGSVAREDKCRRRLNSTIES